MKSVLWMTTMAAMAYYFTGCTKSKGPSPEDTALYKGTDRVLLWVIRVQMLAATNSHRLGRRFRAGVVKEISYLKIPSGPILTILISLKPFEPIYFGFDQYATGPDEPEAYKMSLPFFRKPHCSHLSRRLL